MSKNETINLGQEALHLQARRYLPLEGPEDIHHLSCPDTNKPYSILPRCNLLLHPGPPRYSNASHLTIQYMRLHINPISNTILVQHLKCSRLRHRPLVRKS